jgi:septum formation protein
MTQIILASQSPRRVELLTKMGVPFIAIPSSYEERLDESRSAEEVAMELALGKANDVSKQHPEAFVIGSDTVVALGGRQMEKPKDIADAREMLTALAGHESTVSTGVAIVGAKEHIQQVNVATTKVYFKPDSPEVSRLREDYLASGDWKDKAGGYGIQSGAATLIERIDGDYDTIVGLPAKLLAEMLTSLGISTVDKQD